jgi:hypothetical protein
MEWHMGREQFGFYKWRMAVDVDVDVYVDVAEDVAVVVAVAVNVAYGCECGITWRGHVIDRMMMLAVWLPNLTNSRPDHERLCPYHDQG